MQPCTFVTMEVPLPLLKHTDGQWAIRSGFARVVCGLSPLRKGIISAVFRKNFAARVLAATPRSREVFQSVDVAEGVRLVIESNFGQLQ